MKIHYKDLENYKKDSKPIIQRFCIDLVDKSISGKLEIYPNNNEDGDGIPDVIYPSIATAAIHANCRYLQKGVHYAGWFPILKKDMK